MFRVYTKEEKSKEVFCVNLSKEDLDIVAGGDVFIDHKDLNRNEYIIVERDDAFIHPMYRAEKNIIEEATREERIIIFNEMNELQQGEYLENGNIVKIECPQDLMRPAWNLEKKEWYETMSRNELILQRKDKILEYAKLKREIEELEEFADEFESDETIALLKEKQAKLKKEIVNLAGKIKKMAK